MPTVEETVTIDVDPSVVWDFLTHTENIPAFENQLIELEQLTPGEVGLGTRWKGAINVLGRTVEWADEMVEFVPQDRMRMKSIEGKIPFEIVYTLQPAGRATRFTYRIETEPGLGGVFGKLADTFVQRSYARSLRTNLANLKDLLEVDA